MTQVVTNLVADGMVRLESHPLENTHTLILRPWNGGGLLLKNPTTGVWDMCLVKYDGTMAGSINTDVYNCKLDGTSGQRIKRFLRTKAGQLNGPYSGQGDVTINMVTGAASWNSAVTSTPQFAASWNGRFARGDSLGEKLYFEMTVNSMGTLMGFGLIAETQASPSPPFSVPPNMGPGINGCFWYSSGSVYTNYTSGTPAVSGTIQTYTGGQTIACAVDFTSNKVWFRNVTLNGNWNNDATQNPATGTGGWSISNYQNKRMIPVVGFWSGGNVTFNLRCFFPFGTAGTVPTGFAAGWNIPLGQTYDVWAVQDGAQNVSLELSTCPSTANSTNIVIDTDTGFAVKSGDATRRLVGRCGVIPDANEAGFNITGDTSKHSMVCSYFQQRSRRLGVLYYPGSLDGNYTNNPSFANLTPINFENDASHRCHWVGFATADGMPGRCPRYWVHGGIWNTTNASQIYAYLVPTHNGDYVTDPLYINAGAFTQAANSTWVGTTYGYMASSEFLFDDNTQSHGFGCAIIPNCSGYNIAFQAAAMAEIWE